MSTRTSLFAGLVLLLPFIGAARAQDAFPPTCFPNSPGAGTGIEQSVRQALIGIWARHAAPGEDGEQTVEVRNVAIQQHVATDADFFQYRYREGSTIYDVRATVATCRDYNSRVQYLVMTRNYVCGARPGDGGLSCLQAGRSADLGPDVQRSVNKKR